MRFTVSEPMLAARFNILAGVELPLMVSPKYDGIRCLIVERNGRAAAVTRTMRPIPNVAVRTWLEEHCPVGLDGELIVRGEDFHGTSAALMSRSGKPDFFYAVFDFLDPVSTTPLTTPFAERHARLGELLAGLHLAGRVERIEQTTIGCITEIDALMSQALEQGHEGLVLRRPDGHYKTGRSTDEQGLMLKLKPSLDDEAEIVGVEAEQGDLFGSERLGALRVRLHRSVEFRIGSGFSDRQRQELWSKREALVGEKARFSYQAQGMKSAPRFPVFQGIRHEADL